MNPNPNQRFLAEWQPQEAVLLAWPFPQSDWQPWLNEIQQTYVELAAAVADTAIPVILCQDTDHRHHIMAQLGPDLSSRARFICCAYNDTWCRDYGPVTLGEQGVPATLASFRFTGWGEKYNADADDAVNSRLGELGLWQLPVKQIGFELEGGAIETDGEGTLLTTEACLMAGNRNHTMTQADVEQALISHLGVERVIWLKNGFLIGDDTDSHVDNLVRFASPDTLVYACCDNPDDPHFEPLKAMEAEVHSLRKRDGQPYECLPLMIPEAIRDEQNNRLPASYVNFLILNDTVIVPVFGCASDQPALQQLRKAFPDYRLLTVSGQHLIKQYGGPHCATMQLPRGTLNPAFPGDTTC